MEEKVPAADEATALNARAAEQEAAGDLAGAVETYARVLEIDPRNLAALVNRAGIWVAMAEYGKALDDYRGALEVAPDHWPALYNRAVLYHGFADHFLGTGELDKAVAQASGALMDHTHVIQLRPDLADGYLARAKAYVTRAGVHQARGRASDAYADIAAAVDDVDQALRRAPADWPSRDEAEDLRTMSARRAEHLADARPALAVDAAEAASAAYYYLGVTIGFIPPAQAIRWIDSVAAAGGALSFSSQLASAGPLSEEETRRRVTDRLHAAALLHAGAFEASGGSRAAIARTLAGLIVRRAREVPGEASAYGSMLVALGELAVLPEDESGLLAVVGTRMCLLQDASAADVVDRTESLDTYLPLAEAALRAGNA
jgi:tetratricopeptide (TPR) repeat protein